ncbi:hypothetical protein IPM65_02080 [Candidatus Roizmanbacteria bacterium]|nr:MAG: hypothetical protein IPM65_02080 [Candidatus Roizmanbacteria bacterium]
MKNIYRKLMMHGLVLSLVFTAFIFLTGGDVSAACSAAKYQEYPACTSIQTGELGFQIPSLGDILTFAIRAFFVIAGLAALFYMLIGAFAWVTSGGDKDAVSAAREKIQAAVIGMILIVAVLAIIWTLEQVIFKRRICLGLSCPLTLPGLVETTTGENCCTCVSNTGGLCSAVNATNGCTNVVIDAFDPTKTCK